MISATLPRTALVTGADACLGRAVALALADAGFAVALHAREAMPDAESTAAKVCARGTAAIVLAADLTHEAQAAALLGRAEAALGPIGVLVNNASILERDEWDSVTRESWDRHLESDLRAPFVLTQAFARALPRAAEGAVFNIIDERVRHLARHFVSYTAAKAGMRALTQSLALALAPRIRVNAIGPALSVVRARPAAAQFDRHAPLPLPHDAEPDEIARGVLTILALPSMTGQMLVLDGGKPER